MAIQLTVTGLYGRHSQEPGKAFFTLTVTAGTTYATGGVTVDMTKIVPPGTRSGSLIKIDINSNGGHTGYYTPGTTIANGKIQLFNGTTEVAAATSLTGLVLVCEASFGANDLFGGVTNVIVG